MRRRTSTRTTTGSTQGYAERTFRFPLSLKSGLKELANRNHRSVNQEIIVAIEQWLKHNGVAIEEKS